MTYAKILVCEEPLRPNPYLHAVDDASETIALAEFEVTGLQRYSFRWAEHEPGFDSDAIHLLDSILEFFPNQPATCVAGWRHETPMDLTARHRYAVSALRRAGWQVHTEQAIGIALKCLEVGTLARTREEIRSLTHLGWFIVIGSGISATQLLTAPFRGTIQSFCWIHRLQPSKAFLEGLRRCDGTVAYLVEDDMIPPQVIIVTPRGMRDELSPLAEVVQRWA